MSRELADTPDLRSYQWAHRLLIVGTPSAEHDQYRAFMTLLDDHAQSLTDRDVQVFHLLESGESRVGNQLLSLRAAAALREQLGLVSGQFTTVLIGKDGGEKQRSINRVVLVEMLGLIDTMPMRQQEMLKRAR